jgi:hypothetical protein
MERGAVDNEVILRGPTRMLKGLVIISVMSLLMTKRFKRCGGGRLADFTFFKIVKHIKCNFFCNRCRRGLHNYYLKCMTGKKLVL